MGLLFLKGRLLVNFSWLASALTRLDINPIEQAWDKLDRALSQVKHKPATKEELLFQLQLHWDNVYQMKI